jgi:succinylarginine dihydrolase
LLRKELDKAAGEALDYIEVASADVSLEAAVNSYLFNSQLITRPGSSKATLIVPMECRESASVHAYLQKLEAGNTAIGEVCYFDLRQSMNNGGGPACLRLRVVMSEAQQSALHANVLLNEGLYKQLRQWVEKPYRDELAPSDLADPSLLVECRTALDELSQLLRLGSVYDFQR